MLKIYCVLWVGHLIDMVALNLKLKPIALYEQKEIQMYTEY